MIDIAVNCLVIDPSRNLVVGVLGLCVAAYFGYLGLNGNTWMIIIALMIGLENYQAIQGASNPPWQRRN